MQNVFFLVFNITRSAGTERAVCNLANILSSSGKYAVSIISIASESDTAYYPLNEEISIIHLGIDNTVANIFKKLSVYKKVEREMRKFVAAGSVLIGTDVPYNAIIAKFKNCHTIGCSHMGGKAKFNFRGLLRFFAYRKLERFVVLTEADKRNYRHLKHVSVIPNSLSFPPDKISGYSNKNILAIGRLHRQKGYDMLIDVAAIVLKQHPDWTFTICGTGEEKIALLTKIRDLQLESSIKIVEPTKDVVLLYHSASIYVMTSRYEGLPMVLIEAQSCGLPIVSFDCPEGPSSIIHDGEDGFLVEKENVNVFAEKLLLLMNDAQLRERFGSKAFKNSEGFSTERIARLWFDLLDDMETEKENGRK